MDGFGQIQDSFQHLAPLFKQQGQLGYAPPRCFSKWRSWVAKEEEIPNAAEVQNQKTLQLMCQLMLRQERDINLWKTQDSFVLHLS